ncbi:putative plastid light harvesting protein [Pelagophyceae sp. CCMP2097]|nr:putative plastid light harvesting protein [Pelagophyceae sp. CCMP2097]|mmetsp:Transcript_20797/g.70484  ORF Transcript_20797/g.70484 Transcript_20797/m.70484 type:complete len:263 (+) Transcript_20797:99-887(+)|eukprot:CAMPEP_0184095024 /NCGR_PEP_ID=MMETSP0974-20121125/9557_1 /TAXON_ID=483370 /ORGANISM="non described non described, Strain CCMP2097" /LENGTH=262 /DNA_ID=CAMNT_0026397815 /DNA_START=66 /DNA_END=854 /DNA_ORIENTATION=+
MFVLALLAVPAAALVSHPSAARALQRTVLREGEGEERSLPPGQPNLASIVGVYPGKNMAADYGFDPLGLANTDLTIASSKDKERTKEDIVLDYRDAELRHGRLAMLCALAWPVQELLSGSIAQTIGAPTLLSAGRSPSILNGGLGSGPVPLFMLGTALAIGALDLRAIEIKEAAGEDWLPGDFGFDPLRLSKGLTPVALKDVAAKEINNGRLAMLAVVAYVVQEAATGEPIVSTSEQLFTPIIFYPWFQQLFDNSFGMSAFK